jgi:hypothetical protein
MLFGWGGDGGCGQRPHSPKAWPDDHRDLSHGRYTDRAGALPYEVGRPVGGTVTVAHLRPGDVSTRAETSPRLFILPLQFVTNRLHRSWTVGPPAPPRGARPARRSSFWSSHLPNAATPSGPPFISPKQRVWSRTFLAQLRVACGNRGRLGRGLPGFPGARFVVDFAFAMDTTFR